jgi:protein-S-isoprenylcysteine O-methyltransferase Ste14
MNRILTFLYGAGNYAVSLLTFLYLAGFIGNFAVPKSMDSPAAGQWQTALCVDLALLLVFALQHSVMARPGFKRALTRVVPVAIERSTYMLATNLTLLILFWQWRPLGGMVWSVQNETGRALLYVGHAFGWALLLFAIFVINHFELFGLRRMWRHLIGKPQAGLQFRAPFLHRIVRHPVYVGWLCIFWITPVMTVTHLFFAVATTVYIFVAIRVEERDLVAIHPEYAAYRQQAPMIAPGMTLKEQL